MPFVCDGVKVKFIIFVLILKKKIFWKRWYENSSYLFSAKSILSLCWWFWSYLYSTKNILSSPVCWWFYDSKNVMVDTCHVWNEQCVGYSCLIYVIFVGTSGRPGCVGECQVLGILPSRQQVTARPGVCLQKKVRPSRSKVTTLTNVLTGKLKV